MNEYINYNDSAEHIQDEKFKSLKYELKKLIPKDIKFKVVFKVILKKLRNDVLSLLVSHIRSYRKVV